MSPPTPPLLTGVLLMESGDFAVLNGYHGIKITVIPDGGTVRVSKVNDDEASIPKPPVHDLPTQVDITTETTFEADWPYYLVTVESGTARVALV